MVKIRPFWDWNKNTLILMGNGWWKLKSDHFGIEIIYNIYYWGGIIMLKSDHFGIEIIRL